MKRLVAVFLVVVMLLGTVTGAMAADDLFEVTNAIFEELSGDQWNLRFTVKNNTGEAVHDLQLSVCFTDMDGNIIETTFPAANVRVKPDKSIGFETSVKKALNPYAVYVDQVAYYDNNEELKKAYLDNTVEYMFSELVPSAPAANQITQEPVATAAPTPELTPEPTQDPNGPFDFEVEFSGQNRKGTYYGENKNGIPDGQGRFVSSDNLPALTYEGGWLEGKPAGKGYLKDEGFKIHFNTKAQGEYNRTGPYEGDTLDGVPNGKGSFSTVNDAGITWHYVGEFGNGTFNGEGVQTWDSEEVVSQEGTFKDGEFIYTLLDAVKEITNNLECKSYDVCIDFIKQHEDLFTTKLDVDATLVSDSWTVSAFRREPQNHCDKLIRVEDFSVLEIADANAENVYAIIGVDGSGVQFVCVYTGEKTYSVNQVIKEIYILPLDWNSSNGGYVYGLMVYPGNKVAKEEVVPESTPLPVSNEAPADADRSIMITSTDFTVATGGKKLKLSVEITNLKEDAPSKSVLVWSSSDTTVAKVDANGNVTGVKPGTAVISCSLKDNSEVKCSATVTVIRPVKGLKLSERTLTIWPQKSATVNATISPKDATNQNVVWKSSAPSIANVSQSGLIHANFGGDCEITCTTEDGAYSATVKVHVPSFSVNQTEYTVYSKDGITIPVDWYCNDSLTLTDNGGSYFDANWVDGEGKITIIPKKAGKGSIVVYNEKVSKDKVTISITIDHSATYDTQSYPSLDYDRAMRYPDGNKNRKVSFSGQVLQVMYDTDSTTYRISSKGRYDNVVYVTIKNDRILKPVIENDNVTVYGTLNGNMTYTSTMGQAITIPWVEAERIIVK